MIYFTDLKFMVIIIAIKCYWHFLLTSNSKKGENNEYQSNRFRNQRHEHCHRKT